MADDHDVIGARSEGAVGFVCKRDIVQDDAGLEFEGGDDGDGLVGDELNEGVFGLVGGCDSPCVMQVSMGAEGFMAVGMRILAIRYLLPPFVEDGGGGGGGGAAAAAAVCEACAAAGAGSATGGSLVAMMSRLVDCSHEMAASQECFRGSSDIWGGWISRPVRMEGDLLMIVKKLRMRRCFSDVCSSPSTMTNFLYHLPDDREERDEHPPGTGAGDALASQAHDPPDQAAGRAAVAVKVRFAGGHLLVLFELLVRVGRVADGQHALDPARGRRHGAAVGEAVERGFAAVRAGPAVADATERERRDRGVEEAVVDAGATAAGLRQDLVGFGFGAEGVKTQRGGVDFVGGADGLVDVVDGEDRDQRPERLVLEKRIVGVLDLHHRRLEEQRILVGLAAENDLTVGAVEHRLEAQPLALIDNLAVVRTVLCAFGLELLESDFELSHKSREDVLVDHDVVLRHTDLTDIDQFRPEQSACREARVRVLRDDGRVAATKLQRDWRQSLGRLLGNDGSHHGTTSVEDLVPLLLQERCRLRHGTLHALICFRVETLLDDVLHDPCCVGRILRRLEHGGTASGNGAHQRTERELDGEVVGSDDQDGTERVFPDPWGHEAVDQIDVFRLLVLGEALQILGHEQDVVQDPAQFRQIGLVCALAQVELAGLQDRSFSILQSPVERAELLQTPFDIAGLVGMKFADNGIVDGGDAVDGGHAESWKVVHGEMDHGLWIR
nr:hypothetical protein CFP56_73764 [Quercus suber]